MSKPKKRMQKPRPAKKAARAKSESSAGQWFEKAYEVLDALESGGDAKFREELGDLLLQVVFHAQIAAEEGRFTVTDVVREIHQKMVRRHPHVFGEKSARDAAEVLKNWE